MPLDSEDPVEDLDFSLLPAPTGSASGTVRDQENGADPPVAGVLITVTGPNDAEYQIRTGSDGTWQVDGLPPGDYTATVTSPAGAQVIDEDAIPFTINAADDDEPGLDFLVDQAVPDPTYSAGGTVTEETGEPVPGIEVLLQDPDGNPFGSATTDNDGDWSVDGVPAGDGWSARVVVPEGFQLEPPLTFDVDADVDGLNFVLVLIAATPSPTPSPSPSPSVTPTPTPTPTSSPTSGPGTSYPAVDDGSADGSDSGTGLASTGASGPVTAAAAATVVLLLAGGGLLLAIRLRRRTGR